MPKDGDSRYNSETMTWEQFLEPPGTWKPVELDFGQLDRPVDALDVPGPDDTN